MSVTWGMEDGCDVELLGRDWNAAEREIKSKEV